MAAVNAELIGDRELVSRFEGMPDTVKRILADKMGSEMDGLLAAVRGRLSTYAVATQENHGPSGKLADTLRSGVIAADDEVVGTVASDRSVPYALVQEYGGGGGTEIVPVSAAGLSFTWHGKRWFLQHVTRGDTPAKRYLRGALEDFGPGAVDRLHEAVMDGLRKDAS